MSRGVLEQLVIVNVKVELSVADDSATQPMETGTWKFAYKAVVNARAQE